LNLVLKETDVRDNGHCVAKAVTDLLGDDDAVHFPVLSDCLSHPSHVSSQLTDRAIGTPRAFQLEHEEGARVIDGQNVDWANCGWELDTVAPRRINVQPQSLSLHINGANVLRDEVA